MPSCPGGSLREPACTSSTTATESAWGCSETSRVGRPGTVSCACFVVMERRCPARPAAAGGAWPGW